MDKTKEEEDYRLFDQLNDFLQNYDTSRLDNNQGDFRLYMDLARRLSWDIPSAFPCDHLQDLGLTFGDEVPMHFYTQADLSLYRDKYPSLLPGAEEAVRFWEAATIHFRDIHGLDITDINWNFDT